MQTYNAIPLMQTPAPAPKKDSSQTSPKSDRQSSFTDALDREMAQGQQVKPQDQAKPQDKETAPGEQPQQTPGANAMPWLIQIPLQEQMMPGITPVQMQQPQIQAPAQVQTAEPAGIAAAAAADAGEAAAVLAVNPQAGMTESRETAEPQIPQAADTEAVPELFTVKDRLQTAPQASAFAQAVQGQTEQADETAAIRPQAAPQTAGEQEQTDTGREAKAAAPGQIQVQPDRTAQAADRTAEFSGTKPAGSETVDMTDAKAGIQKLSETMAKHMAKGSNEFEIWLEPANLGKLAIKVAYESGRAAVSIMCMNEKTMEIISQNAKNLGNILEQNTGTNTVVVIEHPESDYLQQNAEKENRGGYEQQQNSEQNNDDGDAESQSFLQQLRLGLMQ